ncbi:SDR family NAD(P)-dependent oxidoreductase [Saccharopolyspora erythraea]|uniref:SDR family NAD(P)-dependent oxidoreductase n=1 Tax=Saccharopolyspora erythraea TaxID=1836 RepID=UPI001BA80E92|nr:SDR family NAD(P)-dependent oxidoreductase [Saccharopolyspora erythraea]QUH03167.1 SDR family NAD(P)-dependent oxidoreductase [Saccharopolyspora erythraea]
MRTIVVSGGTDGIGRGIADFCLRRGDTVVVVGRNAAKGEAFLTHASDRGAAARARFIRADLSLVRDNERVVAEIRSEFPAVDALVLCAQHFRSTRLETDEGFENTFALYYLSRFLLGHGLVEVLERGENPVVVNVCAPGVETGEIRWDDLQLRADYDGMAAIAQASRANDLLGVSFANVHGASRVRYVLFNPGGVATSFSGEYDVAMATAVERARAQATPVAEAIVPILAVLDDPPAEQVSAFARGESIPLRGKAFDASDADRLREETLARLTGTRR